MSVNLSALKLDLSCRQFLYRETDDWPAEVKDPQVIGVKALVKSSAISNRLNKKETTSGYDNAAYDDDNGCSIVAFKTLGNSSTVL